MINYGNIIGNQEDWANLITNVEEQDAPFLDWLPTGDKPVNVLHQYQAEIYRDPVDNSQVDGKPVTGFLSAGDSRGTLKALVQYMSKAAAVKKLHQDVSNIAGVEDELAREIDKSNWELSTDIEAAFLEDDDHREDNTTVGYKTRGVGSWISTSAQSLYPVPSSFRPPSASVITTATGSITENAIIDVLESVGNTVKSSKPMTAFCAPKAKRIFNNMPLFTPASVLVGGSPTGATGVVYNKGDVNTVGRVAERYMTDYGVVDLRISWRNVFLGGNTIEKTYTTYFLHRDKWNLRWNQKPKWMRKEYQGGSYEAFCEAILMLECLNPKGEAKWQPTS
ncbi:MAG: hypothetical protein E6Q97_37625 [Desulfurellales bacterium]|nr:MAG: hypothetical protein E6Q97_37625 [Desulfurellales bacterium]